MPDKRERKGNPVHHLAYVSVEDDGMAGRRPLWGYGPFHVAALAKRARRTVRKVTAAGVIPLHIPAEAVAWALDRRGFPKLADQVLESLGYGARYSIAEK